MIVYKIYFKEINFTLEKYKLTIFTLHLYEDCSKMCKDQLATWRVNYFIFKK